MLQFETLVCPEPAPRNLLPAALPDIIPGMADPGTRPSVFFRSKAGDLYIEDFKPGSDPLDPLSNLWPAIEAADSQADRTAPISLGPRSSATGGDRRGIPAASLAQADTDPTSQVEIGIIDAGITFWNPAFRDAGADTSCRFASFGALKLNDRQIVAEALTPVEIQQYCAGSDADNRRALSRKYPESVYGDRARWPLIRPNGLAHGTAMTELVLSTAPESARLHGLELPVSVVRDLTGGQMTAVMEVALLALIEQVRHRRQSVDKLGDTGFRLVVLMAFGFTGGPMDGSADILKGLERTLTRFNAAGYDIELVLPVGNQLQDQLHARLEPGQNVGWRVLPDDHSTNTVEIIHPGNCGGLSLAAPRGAFVTLPNDRGLFRILVNDQPIGALWSEEIRGDRIRTRISLAPTASSQVQASVAPAGKWRVSCNQTAAKLWILRDETGFEEDPYQPARASWFEDRSYRRFDKFGMPALVDEPHRVGEPLSVVRRDGCASILASSRHDKISVVSAVLDDCTRAPYASLLPEGSAAKYQMSLTIPDAPEGSFDMQPLGPFVGRAVLGNGGATRFRAAGTSLAAALKAGEIAGK